VALKPLVPFQPLCTAHCDLPAATHTFVVVRRLAAATRMALGARLRAGQRAELMMSH
jgi:hypothetical protein